MAQYDTAPAVAMGIGREYDLDRTLHVEFFKGPVLDELLSYGWAPGSETSTIDQEHPRFEELKKLGRIRGEDPKNPGMFFIRKTDAPHYREAEFIRIIRRGEDPADVMSNMPETKLCDHPARKRCPVVPSGNCLKNRFADRYEAWLANVDPALAEGLPLSEVPFINAGWRETLLHRNVRTAEQLAELSADVAAKMPGVTQLQARVAEFLASTKDKRGAEALKAELAQRDARIAALEAKLGAGGALTPAPRKQKQPGKPGRPKRASAE